MQLKLTYYEDVDIWIYIDIFSKLTLVNENCRAGLQWWSYQNALFDNLWHHEYDLPRNGALCN